MRIGQRLLFGATTLTLVLGSAYGAGSQSKDQDPGFNALDKNYDGYLSSAEAAGNPDLAAHFNTVDRNHDGKVSRVEYLEAVAKKDFHAAQEKLSHIFGSMESNSSAGNSGSPRR